MSSNYSTSAPTTTVDEIGSTKISTVHSDILLAHILTRLDGPTLASTSCASSHLRALSSSDHLWRDLCAATWPSVAHQRVTQLISTFPAGHRSFYSDSFPILDLSRPSQPSSELISAVDIHYCDKLIFSQVKETERANEWFDKSPFVVDMIDRKESVSTPVRISGDEKTWMKDLEEKLTLSWILIDPTQKRAANLSTRRPVLVQRRWWAGEIELRFATIVSRCRAGSSTGSDHVQCGMVVTCGGKEGGEMEMREVRMHLEDLEGKHLSGEESLFVLGSAINGGKRKKLGKGNEGRERFEQYLERKREWREKKQRRERALDLVSILVGVYIFVSFFRFILFR
ncbi:hypothetical protein UlMin_017616 [Ulmus minor]